jgi:predicted nucleic acid-binding protein
VPARLWPVERKADILIIDEWKGRAMARSRILPIIGALGVLGDAFQQRLIDDPLEILAVMRQHGFRINDQLVAKFQVLLRTRYAR